MQCVKRAQQDRMALANITLARAGPVPSVQIKIREQAI
jgi:hypothetical protein